MAPLGEHTCEYRTSDDSLDWLAMRVGMFGVDFDVHEPPSSSSACTHWHSASSGGGAVGPIALR